MITYEVGENLYINMTNRCSNACEFCLREIKETETTANWRDSSDLAGSSKLWLDEEPSVSRVIDELGTRDLNSYKEIVFCGFGEPFMRFDECLEIAKWLKQQRVKVRVNTNGQANLIHNKDVTPHMAGAFDVVSISLNAKSAAEYDALCHSTYGEQAFYALQEFAKLCAAQGIEVVMTVVDLLELSDIERCREIAQNCGASLRVREQVR